MHPTYSNLVPQARHLIALLLITSLSACVSIQHTVQKNPYESAISDAAVASPDKVRPLLALPDQSTVPVVSWVNEKRLPCKSGETPCTLTLGKDRMWVTLSGEVQNICRSWNLSADALRRRLEQLLGLPMDSPVQYRKTHFVSMSVARNRIDRPCLGLSTDNPAHPSCSLNLTNTIPTDLREFVLQQMASSYIERNPAGPGYPFTRLGYTYDWHPEAASHGHYGASEFVLAPESNVQVFAQTSTDEYCNANATTSDQQSNKIHQTSIGVSQ